MASYLLDTNIALRLIDKLAPEHQGIRDAVVDLFNGGHTVFLAPQVIYEFFVVATRPSGSNGFGWNSLDADQYIAGLMGQFTFQPDPQGLVKRWRSVVVQDRIVGKRAHDMRLVAYALEVGIESIVTLNPSHFSGSGLNILRPQDLHTS